MKSKRFTTLIAIFVISLLSCAAMLGFTVASADDTATGNVGDYFTADKSSATMTIQGNDIVFSVTEDTVITSKNTFYLPETLVTAAVNGVKVSYNTVDATEAGLLKITIKPEGDGEHTVTVNNIKTADKPLYTITDGKITANADAIYVCNLSLSNYDKVIYGYDYSAVTFDAYQPFAKSGDIKKEFGVVKGTGDAKAIFEAYMNNATENPELNVGNYGKNYTIKSMDATAVYGAKIGEAAAIVKSSKLNVVTVDTIDAETDAPAYDLTGFIDGSAAGKVSYTSYVADVTNGVRENKNSTGPYVYLGSSYSVPMGIRNYIVSDYFASSDLEVAVYYKIPGSDIFTKLNSSATTKKITLSKLGTYEFYVLATDPIENALVIDEDWTLETNEISGRAVKGYYDDADKLMVPVFSFRLENRGPQVTAADEVQTKGYIGFNYTKVSSFTVKGNDVTTYYTLLWNSSETLEYSEEESSSWIDLSEEAAATAAGWTDEELDNLAWNVSTLNFTPQKAGTYVVHCLASDNTGATVEAVTDEIRVDADGMRKVEVNTTYVWFEKNWKSLLFLGIALVSLIAIIVLLFVKPKEEKEAAEGSKK